MTEKQETRALSLLVSALTDNFKDGFITTEQVLLFNALKIEDILKKLDKEKRQISAYSMIITAVMKKRFNIDNESNVAGYAEKIEKIIEDPDKYMCN